MVAVSVCDSPASSENTRMYSRGRRIFSLLLVDWASLVGTGISTGSAYLICRTFAPGSSLGRLSYFPVGPSGCRVFRVSCFLFPVSCFIPFLRDPMTTATRFKRCPTSLPAIDIHSLSTRFEGRRPQAGFGEGLRICSHSGSFGGVSKSRHFPRLDERPDPSPKC